MCIHISHPNCGCYAFAYFSVLYCSHLTVLVQCLFLMHTTVKMPLLILFGFFPPNWLLLFDKDLLKNKVIWASQCQAVLTTSSTKSSTMSPCSSVRTLLTHIQPSSSSLWTINMSPLRKLQIDQVKYERLYPTLSASHCRSVRELSSQLWFNVKLGSVKWTHIQTIII